MPAESSRTVMPPLRVSHRKLPMPNPNANSQPDDPASLRSDKINPWAKELRARTASSLMCTGKTANCDEAKNNPEELLRKLYWDLIQPNRVMVEIPRRIVWKVQLYTLNGPTGMNPLQESRSLFAI